MKLLGIIIGLLVIFALLMTQVTSAQKLVNPSPEPTAAPATIQEINSYELFWPLVAGKTVDDGFIYSLKRLKENLRGIIIFGKVEKADYSVLLATKRVLEAEKLINENKYELANKTLNDALNQLSVAEEKIQGFSRPEKSSTRNKEMVGRLSNIEKLANLLASRENNSSSKLREIADKVSSIANKLQG